MLGRIFHHGSGSNGAKQPHFEYLETIDLVDETNKKPNWNKLLWESSDNAESSQNVVMQDMYKEAEERGKVLENDKGYREHGGGTGGGSSVEVVVGYQRQEWAPPPGNIEQLALLQAAPGDDIIDLETIDDYVIKGYDIHSDLHGQGQGQGYDSALKPQRQSVGKGSYVIREEVVELDNRIPHVDSAIIDNAQAIVQRNKKKNKLKKAKEAAAMPEKEGMDEQGNVPAMYVNHAMQGNNEVVQFQYPPTQKPKKKKKLKRKNLPREKVVVSLQSMDQIRNIVSNVNNAQDSEEIYPPTKVKRMGKKRKKKRLKSQDVLKTTNNDQSKTVFFDRTHNDQSDTVIQTNLHQTQFAQTQIPRQDSSHVIPNQGSSQRLVYRPGEFQGSSQRKAYNPVDNTYQNQSSSKTWRNINNKNLKYIDQRNQPNKTNVIFLRTSKNKWIKPDSQHYKSQDSLQSRNQTRNAAQKLYDSHQHVNKNKTALLNRQPNQKLNIQQKSQKHSQNKQNIPKPLQFVPAFRNKQTTTQLTRLHYIYPPQTSKTKPQHKMQKSAEIPWGHKLPGLPEDQPELVVPGWQQESRVPAGHPPVTVLPSLLSLQKEHSLLQQVQQ